jgi:hypothetical protein
MSGLQGSISDAVVYRGELYAAGVFALGGSTPAAGLAKWNGMSWVAVGGFYANANTTGNGAQTVGSATALAVYNNRLYVGGLFKHVNYVVGTTVTSIRANNLVAYDGTTGVFSPLGAVRVVSPTTNTTTLGAGVTGVASVQIGISSMVAGPGGLLYIGGDFDQVLNTPTSSSTTTTSIGHNLCVYNSATNTLAAAPNGSTEGGLYPAPPSTVKKLVMFDDGTGEGPQLYAGGVFTHIGTANGGLAKLTSAGWTSLGGVTNDFNVTSMVPFDDGLGGHVLAIGAGNFSFGPGVITWDGTTRTTLGSSFFAGTLNTFTDATGTHLYGLNSNTPNLLVRWNAATSTWDPIPGAFARGANSEATGFLPFAKVLASYTPSGGSPELYVFGGFTHVDSKPVSNAARWDGTRWAGVPDGKGPATLALSSASGPNAGGVETISALDITESGHPAFYVGGTFETIGGIVANHVAKFDGNTWTPMGGGIGFMPGSYEYPKAFVKYNDGVSSALYAVVYWDAAGGGAVPNTLRKWNGTSWDSIIGGPDGQVNTAVVWNNAIYVGGAFTTLNNGAINATNIAQWTPAGGWAPVSGDTVDGTVYSLVVHHNALYAGGFFGTIDGVMAVNGVAKWDGATWSPLTDSGTSIVGVTPPPNAFVYSLASVNGILYVGGTFTSPFSCVAGWNDATSSWVDLGGVTGGFVPTVFSMTAGTDVGSTPALFVAGKFTTAGASALPANGIARYDTTSGTWSALTTGGVNGITTAGSPITAARTAGVVGSVASAGNLIVAGGSGSSTGFSDAGGMGSVGFAAWGCPPAMCRADFDQNGSLSVADIFAFLNGWFAGDPRADFNGGGLSVQDIFDFLNAWFAGC